MSERTKINQYLKSFSRYLSRLDETEAQEILKEVESHIYDAIDLAEQQGQQANIDAILSGFGNPRELAEQYVSHITHGTPPPSGFAAIKIVKNQLSKGAFYGFLLLGYGLSAVLFGLAIVKVLYPESVGVWSAASGNSVVVGYVDTPSQRGTELLGSYFSIVALVACGVFARLTFAIHKYLRSSKR